MKIMCRLFGHKFLTSYDKLRDVCARCGHTETSLYAIKKLIEKQKKRYSEAGYDIIKENEEDD